MKPVRIAFACTCLVVVSFLAWSGMVSALSDEGRISSSLPPFASEKVSAGGHAVRNGMDRAIPLSALGADTSGGMINGSHLVSAYGKLPIRFEPNVGQAPADVRYLAHEAGYSIALTEKGAILDLAPAPSGKSRPKLRHPGIGPTELWTVKVGLVDANRHPQMLAERRQSSFSNYFIGRDASKWQSNVANYAAVRYQQVYPGVDWIVYGNPQRLEYDLDLAPHADLATIKLEFAHASRLALDANGDLLVGIGHRTIRQLKPVVYQRTATGEKQFVEAAYVLRHRQVAFALGNYDRDRDLVIDPAIVYSTYLGGSGEVGGGDGDDALALAVDGQGDAYITGRTYSVDFPLAHPLQATNKTGRPAAASFVSKIAADGSSLVYSTYIGGGDGVFANAIAVDRKGCAYVAGSTISKDFPTVRPLQRELRGQLGNAFVTKLNPAGSALVYSTFLGEGDADALAIAVDGAGSAYVAGSSSSADFPTVKAFQKIYKGATDPSQQRILPNAFVAKLDPAGDALVYSTFLGGSGANARKVTNIAGDGDEVKAIAVDSSGSAYVAGITGSDDFPTLHPLQGRNRSGITGFVTKFNASGAGLVYSTFLGGSTGVSMVRAIAVDETGAAYVAGVTASRDFPMVRPLQASNRAPSASNCDDGENTVLGKRRVVNCGTGFVAKLNADGSKLLFSTYLGGTGRVDVGAGHLTGPIPYSMSRFTYRNGFGDAVNAIAVDKSHNVYVGGVTASPNLRLVAPVQTFTKRPKAGSSGDPFGGLYAGFITEFGADGASVLFSSYLGGTDDNELNALAIDAAGNIYVAGTTGSDDYPTVKPLQKVNLGYLDEYLRYASAHGLPRPRLGPYTDGGRPAERGNNAFIAKISLPPASKTKNPSPDKKN